MVHLASTLTSLLTIESEEEESTTAEMRKEHKTLRKKQKILVSSQVSPSTCTVSIKLVPVQYQSNSIHCQILVASVHLLFLSDTFFLGN